MVGPVKIRRKPRRCEKAPTQGEESGSIGYNIPTIESDLVLTRPVLKFQVWNAGKATPSPKGRQEGSEQPRQPQEAKDEIFRRPILCVYSSIVTMSLYMSKELYYNVMTTIEWQM